MTNILCGDIPSNKISLGLLITRIVLGLGMTLHGYPKIQAPFTWLGDKVPGIFQALAAGSEFFGGICLILGLLTPIASLGIISTMIVALFMVHIPQGHPFVAKGGPSCESASIYLAFGILFLLCGSGKYSLDTKFNLKSKCPFSNK